VKFWDASAILPLLVDEPPTALAKATCAADPQMVVWWATQVECASALSRLERTRALDAKMMAIAFARLADLVDGWEEVQPNHLVRDTAVRFLRVHPLRAADALQLAAAFVASDHRPASLPFVTFDERLAEAARKEGFLLVDGAAD
jgi:hypothetical protein